MKEQVIDQYFIEGHLNEEGIALYADGLLLEKIDMLPISIRNHVEDCQQCKKEVFDTYELIRNNQRFKNIETHPFFGLKKENQHSGSGSRMYSFLKIVAVFLIIISVSVVINYLLKTKSQSNSLNSQVTSNSKDTLHEIGNPAKKNVNVQRVDSSNAQNERLAVNFKKSELFEGLISSNFRSADIEVLSPFLGQKFIKQSHIIFEFKGDVSIPVTIKVYNNKGKEMLVRNGISTNRYRYAPKLYSGLFYWKLLREDDLLYVGKFYIN